VIRQLEQKAPFRAAHFSDRAAEMARARGIDAVVIDYNQPETPREAFRGCDTLLLLGPNALDLELNAVEAAKAAGVRHIVKQSVMGAAEEAYSPVFKGGLLGSVPMSIGFDVNFAAMSVRSTVGVRPR
jgi:uncharacterized protein YbjT (DUF2867 family)